MTHTVTVVCTCAQKKNTNNFIHTNIERWHMGEKKTVLANPFGFRSGIGFWVLEYLPNELIREQKELNGERIRGGDIPK
jgi:hypothetical protein